MQRMLVIATVIALGCGAAAAQTASGLGATSPLGIMGSTGSAGAGIPLGATELDIGGLSPAAGTNCVANISPYGSAIGAGSAGTTSMTNSTFDGGGTTTTGSGASMGVSTAAVSTTSATCPSSTLSSTGTASPLSMPGTTGASTLNGGTLPLDSTEIDNGGLSPILTIPAPAIPTLTLTMPTVPTTTTTTIGTTTTSTTCASGATSTATVGTSSLGLSTMAAGATGC